MKKTLLALGATLALASSAVLAQPAPGNAPPPPFGAHPGGPKGHPPKDMTKDQFLARAAEQFEAMDANRDGKVDGDEMRAFHEKMRGKREERREDRREHREGREAPAQR